MGNLRLYGSTSGYVEIAPPAVGGSQVLTLPTDSVQPGMVLVNKTDFSAVSSISVNGCFTSAYQNYLVHVYQSNNSAISGLLARLRSGGTDNTTSSYVYAGAGLTSAGAADNTYSSGYQTYWDWGWNDIASSQIAASMTVFAPYESNRTQCSGLTNKNISGGISVRSIAAAFNGTTQFDGLTIYPSAGTITGTIRVYGLRNS